MQWVDRQLRESCNGHWLDWNPRSAWTVETPVKPLRLEKNVNKAGGWQTHTHTPRLLHSGPGLVVSVTEHRWEDALPSADMVSCVLLEVAASGEMTQHYSAYVSFCGSLPSPVDSVVVSVSQAAEKSSNLFIFSGFSCRLSTWGPEQVLPLPSCPCSNRQTAAVSGHEGASALHSRSLRRDTGPRWDHLVK